MNAVRLLPLSERERELVDRNRGLVYYLVFKITKRLPEARRFEDDIIQDAFLALCRAAQLYDAGHARGAKFVTYASHAVYRRARRHAGECLGLVHLPQYLRERGATHAHVASLDGEPASAEPDPADVAADTEEASRLRAAMRRLPRRERDVLRRRYGMGCRSQTFLEIGDSLGLTREAVRQIQLRAEGKLREALT